MLNETRKSLEKNFGTAPFLVVRSTEIDSTGETDGGSLARQVMETVIANFDLDIRKLAAVGFELGLEMRRRVKEQLKKMGSFEYHHTSFSYVDKEIGEEHFVGVPEQGGATSSPRTRWRQALATQHLSALTEP